MTAGVLLEAVASLLTVELPDEASEEPPVPELLPEYEPPLEDEPVRFLLLA